MRSTHNSSPLAATVAAVVIVVAMLLTSCGGGRDSSATTSSSTTDPRKAKPKPSAVCARLSPDDFSKAVGVAFTPKRKQRDTHCPYAGADGSSVTMFVSTFTGSPQQALTAARTACDAGTIKPIEVGDGGFTCLSGGAPEAVAASAKTLYQLNAIHLVSISEDDALGGFPILLGRLV